VSQVSVRTASDGNGGTATFYLDGTTSTPIATATLPVTGASGVHDLYVVIGGSTSSISNVNWYQFQ
jgi:hypothetical protein